MEYIPVESKISLINKYIQVNILRNNGEAKHVDHLENDIFRQIIEDLITFHDQPTKEDETESLWSAINALKGFQQKQRQLHSELDNLLDDLKHIEETESEQISLSTVIKNLEEIEKKKS